MASIISQRKSFSRLKVEALHTRKSFYRINSRSATHCEFHPAHPQTRAFHNHKHSSFLQCHFSPILGFSIVVLLIAIFVKISKVCFHCFNNYNCADFDCKFLWNLRLSLAWISYEIFITFCFWNSSLFAFSCFIFFWSFAHVYLIVFVCNVICSLINYWVKNMKIWKRISILVCGLRECWKE